MTKRLCTMVQHSACPNTRPSCFRMISEHIAVHLTTCRTLDVPEGAKNRKGLGACLSFPKSFTGIKKKKKKKRLFTGFWNQEVLIIASDDAKEMVWGFQMK